MEEKITTYKMKKDKFKMLVKELEKYDISRDLIAHVLGVDKSTISRYIGNGIRSIEEEKLNILRHKYNVNPEFLTTDSSQVFLFDRKWLKSFDYAFKNWSTVYTEDGDVEDTGYLSVSMDRNIYDYLTTVDTAKRISRSGVFDLDACLKDLEVPFVSEPRIQEFVLIPIEDANRIIDANEKRRTCVNEILFPTRKIKINFDNKN